MARPRPLPLTVQTPTVAAPKDGAAFYIVPPVIVAVAFAFCALVPRGLPPVPVAESTAKPAAVTSTAKPAATKPATSGSAASTARPASPVTPVAASPKDINDGLPEFPIPSGQENLLEGIETVSVSAPKAELDAINAVDGSCENDRHVAVGMPGAGGEAWWQASAPEGAPWAGDCVVIYGGGSASPEGKLIGGFRVDVTLEDGAIMSRDFCEQGFALEGYESWKLGGERRVKSLRVTALQREQPVVLREVMLLGTAAGGDDEEEEEEEDLEAEETADLAGEV